MVLFYSSKLLFLLHAVPVEQRDLELRGLVGPLLRLGVPAFGQRLKLCRLANEAFRPKVQCSNIRALLNGNRFSGISGPERVDNDSVGSDQVTGGNGLIAEVKIDTGEKRLLKNGPRYKLTIVSLFVDPIHVLAPQHPVNRQH